MLADRGPVATDPFRGFGAAGAEQIGQQLRVRLHLGDGGEVGGVPPGLDDMETVPAQAPDAAAVVAEPAETRAACSRYQLDVAQERLVEGDLADVGGDLGRRLRRLRPDRVVEHHDQRVLDRAFGRQRDEVRIGRKAAVPVGLAVDLDGLMHGRQAGGRQDDFDLHLVPPEQPRPAGGDVGRGDQQLDRRLVAHGGEVDLVGQQRAQGIEPQRIEVVRRNHAGHRSQRFRHEWVDRGQVRRLRLLDRLPERLELGPRRRPVAGGEAGGERDGVDGTCAGAAHPAE